MPCPPGPTTTAASRISLSASRSMTSRSTPASCAVSRACRMSSRRDAGSRAGLRSAIDRVDGALVDGQCRLVQRLRERRMRVDGALQILAAGRVFHRQHRLRDQLPGHGTDDVHAEDLVVIACGHDLREAGGLLQGARAAAGEEREYAGLVFAAARLDLLLGEADPGDLRCGIDDRWNHLVIDFAETAGDQVRDHRSLFLALVGQHRAPYAVPDCPYPLHPRAAGVIDADEAVFVQLHPRTGPE